jgi:hypothetical protein
MEREPIILTFTPPPTATRLLAIKTLRHISGFSIPMTRVAIDEGHIYVNGTYDADQYVLALKEFLPDISYVPPKPSEEEAYWTDPNRFKKTIQVSPLEGYHNDPRWALEELLDSLGTVQDGVLDLKDYHPDEVVKVIVQAWSVRRTEITTVKVPTLSTYMPQG